MRAVKYRAALLALACIAGCPARASIPAPAPAPTERSAAAQPAPAAQPSAAPGATAPGPSCEETLADQRMVYLDHGTELHPDREAAFVALCRELPPALQRCASPLYQFDRMDECEVARDRADQATITAWHRMFE